MLHERVLLLSTSLVRKVGIFYIECPNCTLAILRWRILFFSVVETRKEHQITDTYESRYDDVFQFSWRYSGDTAETYWTSYIVERFPSDDRRRLFGDDELDCGLHCEEYSICDFFVHEHHRPCYLGTFQKLEKNGTYLSSISGKDRYRTFYLVYKSELFLK